MQARSLEILEHAVNDIGKSFMNYFCQIRLSVLPWRMFMPKSYSHNHDRNWATRSFRGSVRTQPPSGNIAANGGYMQYQESLLLNNLSWFLIGWWFCYQPIRCQICKSLLTGKGFLPGDFLVIQAPVLYSCQLGKSSLLSFIVLTSISYLRLRHEWVNTSVIFRWMLSIESV